VPQEGYKTRNLPEALNDLAAKAAKKLAYGSVDSYVAAAVREKLQRDGMLQGGDAGAPSNLPKKK
jgi:hypothetical protein